MESDDFLPLPERPEWAGVRPLPPPPTPQPVVAIGRDELTGDLMDYFWAAVQAGEKRCGPPRRQPAPHRAQEQHLCPAAAAACIAAARTSLCTHTSLCVSPSPPCSERVLALTGEIIADLNSSNYTVWEWRWRCLEVGPRGRVGRLSERLRLRLLLCHARAGAGCQAFAWRALGGTRGASCNMLPGLLTALRAPASQALGGVPAHAAAEKALMRSVATANPKNYQLWNFRRRLALALGGAAAAEEVGGGRAALALWGWGLALQLSCE